MAEETEDIVAEVVETPAYVTKDDYDRLAGLVSQMQSSISQGFDALAAQRQTQGQTAEDYGDVSDDELEQALNTGTGADKFRRMVRAEAQRLTKTQIDPLRDEGQRAIAGIIRQTATATLPHYKKYAKEIDDYVDRLPTGQKLNPEVYKIAHDIVVGAHVDDIVKESIEAMKRQGSGDQRSQTPSQTSRGTTGFVPSGTITKPPSTDQDDILANKGQSPDQFAQGLGYKTWDEYMVKTEAYN